MPRNAWWTSFAYVKLQRSILLSAAWIFLPDALWWVCMFLDIVCVCFLLCACSCLIMYLALFSCLQCLSRCIPGACHAWPVHGAASGTRTTTPAPTWATPWLAPTLSSTVRLVLPRVNASGACGGGGVWQKFHQDHTCLCIWAFLKPSWKINLKYLKSWYQLAPSCVTNNEGWRISIYKSADVSEIHLSVSADEGVC